MFILPNASNFLSLIFINEGIVNWINNNTLRCHLTVVDYTLVNNLNDWLTQQNAMLYGISAPFCEWTHCDYKNVLTKLAFDF